MLAATSRRSSSGCRGSSTDLTHLSHISTTPSAATRYSPQIRPAINNKSSDNLPSLLRRSYENLPLLNSGPTTPKLRPLEMNASWDDLDRSVMSLDEPLYRFPLSQSVPSAQMMSATATHDNSNSVITRRTSGNVIPWMHQLAALDEGSSTAADNVSDSTAAAALAVLPGAGSLHNVYVAQESLEPSSFTSRDIIALELLQKRLKLTNPTNSSRRSFRTTREQRDWSGSGSPVLSSRTQSPEYKPQGRELR